jgi:16S rRNA processing protein RimM
VRWSRRIASKRLPQTPDNSSLTLGQIATAQGIKGWLLVRSFTDPPEVLLDYQDWCVISPAGETRQMKLLDGALYRDRLRVRLAGIDERNAALALAGWTVQVARAALPPLAEREHYRDDLLGFEVRNLEGALLGKLEYYVDLPTGSVMVVRGGQVGDREHWVPTSPQHLRKVLVADRSISVDWPADLA